jgi:carnitine 3-dehydrogenase
MSADSTRRVAAIGTGTIGASWTAVFLARGLTVAASDPATGAETISAWICRRGLACSRRLSALPAEPLWAALSFHAEPEAAPTGAEFVQESAPERQE